MSNRYTRHPGIQLSIILVLLVASFEHEGDAGPWILWGVRLAWIVAAIWLLVRWRRSRGPLG